MKRGGTGRIGPGSWRQMALARTAGGSGEGEREELGSAGGRDDLVDRRLGLVLAAAGEPEAGAGAGELEGGDPADAGVRAGDDGVLAVEVGEGHARKFAHDAGRRNGARC